MVKSLVASSRLLAPVLLLAGITAAIGGCIVVPAHGYGYAAPRPVVVAPAPPVVVVRPYRGWWW
jgi:hypothetical protein